MRNLIRFLVVGVMTAGLAATTACGSDDDSGSGGSSGSGGGNTGGTGGGTGGTGGGTAGSGGGTAGSGGGTAGSGGTAGAAGGGGMAGSSGAAGAAGAAGSSGNAAEAFCTKYETVCTFGGTDRYADKADCIAKYNSYDAARQACVETHLGNAEKGDPSLHCPHATGQSPCN